tara:strand:+ start:180 stop:500 length:321 start_codon:yes stop_codon:yes gene_type:complete
MKFKLIITSTNTKRNAQNIANELLNNNISPCVQILTDAHSIYKWNNKIMTHKEHILLIKIPEEQKSACKELLLKIHDYQVPEIIEIKGSILNDKYSKWFLENSNAL